MTRRHHLRLLAAIVTFASTAIGGSMMIERGAVRPGVVMIAAGVATAAVMIWKDRKKNREEGVTTKRPAAGPSDPRSQGE